MLFRGELPERRVENQSFEEEARSKLEVIERARKKGPRTFFFPRVSFPLCFCFFLFLFIYYYWDALLLIFGNLCFVLHG